MHSHAHMRVYACFSLLVQTLQLVNAKALLYLCDVALNDALCDSLRDFHVLGAYKRRIVFGGLCPSANGITCPLLLIVFVWSFRSRCHVQWIIPFTEVLGVVCGPARWAWLWAGLHFGLCETTLQLRILSGGHHVFDEGCNVEDGSVKCFFNELHLGR
jgi:hypothetical protein